MALIKGICKNFGECDMADNKDIQEVDKTNFVCEECGKPLHLVDGGVKVNTDPEKKHKQKLVAIIAGAVFGVVAIIVGILFATGIIGPGEKDGGEHTKIILSESSITMNVGEHKQIRASVDPERKNAVFTFKSSDPKCVEVTNGGIITALKKAKGTTITVKLEDDPSVTAYCKVTVVQPDTTPPPAKLVETLSINEPAVILTVGEKKTFTYKALPKDHVENIIWTSSNESVAKVDTQTGEVTAVKAGTATITVQTDTSNKTASVKVTVNDTEIIRDDPQPHWGKYTGERDKKSRKPNGQGVLTITRSHEINGEMAQPGETITGVFKDGYLNMGKWNKRDGDVVIVKDIKIL